MSKMPYIRETITNESDEPQGSSGLSDEEKRYKAGLLLNIKQGVDIEATMAALTKFSKEHPLPGVSEDFGDL